MSRDKRASNSGHFEEMKKGNLERECIEETCDDHELYEVYDSENHPGIEKYNKCKKIVQDALEFCNKYNINLDEGKDKQWLRTCATLSEVQYFPLKAIKLDLIL